MDSSVILVGVASCLLSCGIGWWLGVSTMKAEVRRIAAASLSQTQQIVSLTAMAEDEHNRRVQTVEGIAIMGKDRDQWKEMFYSAGTGHMAAQSMMMREIARLSACATRAGAKNAAISPAIVRVVDEYAGKHGAPRRDQNNGGIASGPGASSPIETTEKSV